jgi:hypothetical protein
MRTFEMTEDAQIAPPSLAPLRDDGPALPDPGITPTAPKPPPFVQSEPTIHLKCVGADKGFTQIASSRSRSLSHRIFTAAHAKLKDQGPISIYYVGDKKPEDNALKEHQVRAAVRRGPLKLPEDQLMIDRLMQIRAAEFYFVAFPSRPPTAPGAVDKPESPADKRTSKEQLQSVGAESGKACDSGCPQDDSSCTVS